MWKLFAYGKIFTHGKIKSERKSSKKKKPKKKQAQRNEKEYHSVKKRKKSFVKVTGIGGAPHTGIQISNKEVSVKPKFVKHNVKNEVSFYLCKY